MPRPPRTTLNTVYIARASMNNDVIFGVVEGLDAAGEPDENTVFIPMEGHPYSPEPQLTGPRIPLGEMRLLAPVLPSKIICAAKNYADHAAEMDGSVAEEPVLFLKPSTSVIGAGSPILLPGASDRVDHEAELAVVIGRLCKSVPVDRVDEVILGYTCANDVTARDLQARDGQWGRAKGFDSFCPLGPWITTDWLSPTDLVLAYDSEGAQAAMTIDFHR